jgi:hypothetical protein
VNIINYLIYLNLSKARYDTAADNGITKHLGKGFVIIITYICFIPEGIAEASQIFLRDAHVLPKVLSYEE